jgi:hypothetical protein
MNAILRYRVENRLSKREFCERFSLIEQNYNRQLRDSRQFAIIETETVDKLIEIKGEFLK